ncbi:MAG: hypothetical protein ACOVNL_13365 [Prochlorococcaceae cyanobacterium]|jgi:hypothetical protein
MPVIAALSLLAPPVVLSQASFAGPGQPPEGREPLQERLKLTPAQARELFTARQAMERRGIQTRQGILQSSQRCIDAAKDLQSLGACKRTERESYASLLQKERQETRALLQKMGVQLPEARPGSRPEARPAT